MENWPIGVLENSFPCVIISPHMDEMYAKIGGFNFKFSFKNDLNDPKLSYTKNRVEIDLLIYLRVFLITESPKKFDFEIELCDLGEAELLNIESNKKTYTPLFQKITEKKYITYFQNSINQFEIVLKHALLSILKQNGGFGIHSSVANINGKAYLFLGNSGAGKSTAVELLKDKYPTINDDITLVKKIGRKYYVFQTTFVEKAWWIKKTQKLYPIDKIFFLHQSPEFKAEPLTNNEKRKADLLPQIIAAQNPDKNILKNVKDFIKNTNNFYDLYFAKDSEKLTKLISKI